MAIFFTLSIGCHVKFDTCASEPCLCENPDSFPDYFCWLGVGIGQRVHCSSMQLHTRSRGRVSLDMNPGARFPIIDMGALLGGVIVTRGFVIIVRGK